MEHYRPKIGNKKGGYYQGYYCGRCGAPGLPMVGGRSKHGSGICLSNPKMVAILNEANTVEAERKRVFKRKLQYGEKQKKHDWEVTI